MTFRSGGVNRNKLKGITEDILNILYSSAGLNIRKLMTGFALLCKPYSYAFLLFIRNKTYYYI
jgi:hypothetical protein